MRSAIFHITLILLLACPALLFGQQKSLPLNRSMSLEVERSVSSPDSVVHTGMKPLLESRFDLTGVMPYEKDSVEYKSRVAAKIFSEHLLVVDEENFHLTIDPLFNFQYGYDFADTTNYQDTVSLYENTRGFWVRGDIGKNKKVSFESMFYENQKFFPSYLKSYADRTGVVPGEGRYKLFEEAGYDFGYAYANVSFSPNEKLNFQLGHGKHFIGHGYRSMLLSDNAFGYPYFKATTWLWKDKIQYSYMYAQLESLLRQPATELPEALFVGKDASIYYLSFLATSNLEIGLFESVIWNRYDLDEGTQPFNWQSVIPVIGVNSAILGMDDLNNSKVGLNANLKITPRFHLYGQLAVDEFGDQRHAVQSGMKFYDLFTPNFYFQIEYNETGRGYQIGSPPSLEKFSQQGQWLDFTPEFSRREAVMIANYRWKRLFAKAKANLIRPNIEGDSFFFPSNERHTLVQDYQVGYLINPSTNLTVSVGYLDRTQTFSVVESKTQWFYLRIGTSLQNLYYDF
jgi:hypothetical protein